MKVALCQINTRQGDIAGNAELILRSVERAAAQQARVALLPEMALCGYSPRDLLYRRGFVAAVREAEERLCADFPAAVDVLFGSVAALDAIGGGRMHNVAVHASGGRIGARVPKTFVPNYDVFDEGRYFEPGENPGPVTIGGGACGITICEDIWGGVGGDPGMPRYTGDPPGDLAGAGARWIANLSASPYSISRPAERDAMVVSLARRLRRPVALVNLVGGNDEVLFDGHSLAVDAQGRLLARARGFDEDVVVFDVDGDGGTPPEADPGLPHDPAVLERVHEALLMGLRDYARKSGFTRAVLGLSGGIDSALVAALAARALGPDNVTGVAMPSRYSASMSLEDARELAERLGIGFRVIPIGPSFDAVLAELQPHFEGRRPDVTEENIQPRIRGLFLMALSNKLGALLLSTGNKSELAVGYCTLYGDMCGGLAVISDLPKTLVYALARHVNLHHGAPIPERSLTRPPSAELRPDQLDTDSLPEYDALDDILARAIERRETVAEIVAAGHDEAVVRDVLNRLARNEYKRKQMPPGLRVTTKAFGVGRRMPITGSPVWLDGAPLRSSDEQ